MTERRLNAITLVGGRSTTRRICFGLVLPTTGLIAVGYLLPAHRVHDAAVFHSNYADGGPAPLFVCALLVVGWWLARRRGFGAGLLLGPAAIAGAIGSIAPVFLEHLFSKVETGYGESVYAVGIIGLFFVGLAITLLEPILYVGQRRQLHRDVDPQFPTARVVS